MYHLYYHICGGTSLYFDTNLYVGITTLLNRQGSTIEYRKTRQQILQVLWTHWEPNTFSRQSVIENIIIKLIRIIEP